MNLDVNAFIRELAQTRDELEKIVEDIYRDEETVFEELEKLGFDSRYQELFVLNAKLTEGKKRRTGRHYYTHPGTAAYILLNLLPDDYEPKEKAIAYALTHDLVDESMEYNVEQFRNQRELNPHYHDEFDKAVLMTYPNPVEHVGMKNYATSMRIASILQVKDTENPAVANAFLADKLDNMIDLEFDLDIYTDIIFVNRIAHVLFTANQLSEQLHPDMFELAQLAADETVESFGLSVPRLHNTLEGYGDVLKKQQSEIRIMSQEHLKKFGLVTQAIS